MKKNSYWFSIIEIIISTVILTVWVFWVYKLIGNNMNHISNNENLVTLYNNYIPLRECIKSNGYSSLATTYNSGDTFTVHFWTDNMWCNIVNNFDTQYSFTWVQINNQEYFLFAKVVEKDGAHLKLDLNIYNDINGLLFKSWSENNPDRYMIIKN